MKKVIVLLVLGVIANAAFAKNTTKKMNLPMSPFGLSCRVTSCQNLLPPQLVAYSTCQNLKDAVRIIPQDRTHITPSAPALYKSSPYVITADYSEGANVAYVQFNVAQLEDVLAEVADSLVGTYTEGFWADRYYENFQLGLVCNRSDQD